MPSHQVDFSIHGDDMQFVEIELDPGETVVAEAGAMMYLDEGIGFETRMGDGSEPDQGMWGKLKGAGKRALTGESIFMTHFTNQGSGRRKAAFAASVQGLAPRLSGLPDAGLAATAGMRPRVVRSIPSSEKDLHLGLAQPVGDFPGAGVAAEHTDP